MSLLTPAAPVPKNINEVREEFEWQGEKRVRTVRVLSLSGEKVEFVFVPKGEFLMGSPADDKHGVDNERPQHRVTFSKAFWFSKYPVTRGQFAAFVKATEYQTEAEKEGQAWGYGGKHFGTDPSFSWRETGWEQTDAHPVVNVTFNDAQEFTKWAAKTSRLPVRLPTEAEYEYAQRGGTTTRFYTGDKEESLVGFENFADASARATWKCTWGSEAGDGHPFAAPVGSFKPNGFGLHDMAGNVYSWCEDWFDHDLYAGHKDGVTDPKPNDQGEQKLRVCRGSAWDAVPGVHDKSADRNRKKPGSAGTDVGFRLVFTAD